MNGANPVPYRDQVRAGTGRSIAPWLAIAILIAACSNTADTSTTTTSSTTTSSTSSTTSTTTSTMTSTTTSSTLPAGTVGDPALVEQAIADGTIGLEAEFGVSPDDVPVPDLTNPDPLVAMEEILLFDIWVFQNAPRRGLIEVYSVLMSPSWEDLFLAADRMNNGVFRFAEGDGLTISTVEYASEDLRSQIPSDVISTAPAGSVVLTYVYSADPFDILDRDGEVQETNPGWNDLETTAIVSPSNRGWLLFWEGRL